MTVGTRALSQETRPADLNLPNRGVQIVSRDPEMEAKTCPRGAFKLSQVTRRAHTAYCAHPTDYCAQHRDMAIY
ncbi:hypothetical protein GCM10027423_49370 [Spirosoma arcticum]